ncbi:hypothetical protein KDL01_11340 [Actinospica durhamensis]|uniref:HEAT repeat domain-containing protein n=1 Tax=Actinospica durhamensis TaxID=1508375 RepID=A0A941IND9_9ACTN|nr:hypothetical protein [Actinospica durhamensis]MBR7833864.1 hypothetical protein [Actinospica durhamensis]
MSPLDAVEPETSDPDEPAWVARLSGAVDHDDYAWTELGCVRGEPPMFTTAQRERIAALDAGNLGEAVQLLGELLHHHVWQDQGDRIDVARILGALSPAHVDEAAAVLQSVADADESGYARICAAQALAGLGAPFAVKAAGALLPMITDLAATPQLREHAARALAEFGPDYLDRAVRALREVLAATRLDPYPGILAVKALAALNREHHADVSETLAAVAESPGPRPWELVEPLSELGRALPQYAVPIGNAQRALLALPATSPLQRLQTARYHGIDLGSPFDTEVDEILRTALPLHNTQPPP